MIDVSYVRHYNLEIRIHGMHFMFLFKFFHLTRSKKMIRWKNNSKFCCCCTLPSWFVHFLNKN